MARELIFSLSLTHHENATSYMYSLSHNTEAKSARDQPPATCPTGNLGSASFSCQPHATCWELEVSIKTAWTLLRHGSTWALSSLLRADFRSFLFCYFDKLLTWVVAWQFFFLSTERKVSTPGVLFARDENARITHKSETLSQEEEKVKDMLEKGAISGMGKENCSTHSYEFTGSLSHHKKNSYTEIKLERHIHHTPSHPLHMMTYFLKKSIHMENIIRFLMNKIWGDFNVEQNGRLVVPRTPLHHQPPPNKNPRFFQGLLGKKINLWNFQDMIKALMISGDCSGNSRWCLETLSDMNYIYYSNFKTHATAGEYKPYLHVSVLHIHSQRT